MEELREKANCYAEENVINVLKEAFAKVYADGYRDGYKDRESEIPVDLRLNQTKFVDLGLPSGILWSAEYEKEDGNILFLPYLKAQEMSIPTEKQWNELIEHCRWQGNYSSSGITFYGVTCIGPNGNEIKFRSKGYMKNQKNIDNIEYGGGKVYFWIHDEEENELHEKKVICIDKGIKREPNNDIVQFFSGYKCPVRLVKKQDQ